MSDLLDALSIGPRPVRLLVGAAIWALFGGAMLALAAGQALAERALGIGVVGSVAAMAVMWLAWSYWHSVLFPRHRRRHLAVKRNPYRAAFVIDLIPGLSISFSQMLRPSWNGSSLESGNVLPALPGGGWQWAVVLTGWALLVGATALFVSAWRALGAARVGFAGEYIDPESFRPVRSGPYSRVRHPLFWSGIGVSVALPLVCLSPAAAALAATNLVYGFAYNVLEDRRLRGVFGERYDAYAREVPHILPQPKPRHRLVRA